MVPSWPLKVFYVFLKSCFVHFLSFRAKLLNMSRFVQPQRMRIDNTEGVMQKKKNNHTFLIIESITNECLCLSPFPCLPLTYLFNLVAGGCYFPQSISRALDILVFQVRFQGDGKVKGRECVKKEASHPSLSYLDILPFQQPCPQFAWGQERQVSKGNVKHSYTP